MSTVAAASKRSRNCLRNSAEGDNDRSLSMKDLLGSDKTLNKSAKTKIFRITKPLPVLSEAIARKSKNVPEKSKSCGSFAQQGDHNFGATAKVLHLWGINRRPAPQTFGYFVADYVSGLEKQCGQSSKPPLSQSFDIQRLEPFAGSMDQNPADLIRKYGSLCDDLTRHLENVNAIRGKQHTELFKSCVEQRLRASRNLVALLEFSKIAIINQPSGEILPPNPILEKKIVVTSPLEMRQRGPGFLADDIARRVKITGKLQTYKETMDNRKRQLIQRAPDNEKLFTCVIQKSVIVSMIKAYEELEQNGITADITDVSDVVEKYDTFCTNRKKDESKESSRFASKLDKETNEDAFKTIYFNSEKYRRQYLGAPKEKIIDRNDTKLRIKKGLPKKTKK